MKIVAARAVNVLMLHNRYKIKGGEDEVALAEAALLNARGHDVELLELDNDAIPSAGNVRTAVSAVWSQAAYRRVAARFAQKKFDILHVQNFFPRWSPAVYYAAARGGAAVVQSVHNYRLVCPAASLFRDGAHCELCIGKKLAWPGVVNRCYRGSRVATGAVAAMTAAHWALGTWRSSVHQYVALTAYVRDRLVAGDFPPERISIKPNFIVAPQAAASATPAGDYFIYAGRLTEEKGIAVLLEAWRGCANARLRLVGAGALPAGVTVAENVELLGARSSRDTCRLIAGAKALILPASWAEPFGRVVIEAFALGTPVIASTAGALPELIEHGVTGILFETGNARALAAAVARVGGDAGLRARLSENARRSYATSFTDAVNYEQLLAIYDRALRIRNRSGNFI